MNTNHNEIYPYVCVYTGLMEDNVELYTIADHLSYNSGDNLLFDWRPWSVFGTYGDANPDVVKDPSKLNSANKNPNTNYFKEIKIFNRIQEIVKTALDNYIAKYSINLPEKNFIQESVNIAKYSKNFDYDQKSEDQSIMIQGSKAMNFHTDYSRDQDRKDNFLITCNLYFNDDYKDRGIIFNIEGDIFTYKPKAGEVVVFPSGSPLFPAGKKYLHAVETPYGKNKFISRNFMMYEN